VLATSLLEPLAPEKKEKKKRNANRAKDDLLLTFPSTQFDTAFGAPPKGPAGPPI
jgi:hypothetical protein